VVTLETLQPKAAINNVDREVRKGISKGRIISELPKLAYE